MRVVSKRGETTLVPRFKYTWITKAGSNAYDKVTNPQGVVNLGLAENKLCEQLMIDRLSQDDMQSVVVSDLYYPPMHGSQSFREAVAAFLNRKLKTKQTIKAENMLITSGVGAALELLSVTIGDPGDGVLVPTPCYSPVFHDIHDKAKLKPLAVHIDETGEDGKIVFRLTLDKLVTAYDEAIQKGESVCAILLLNPTNPLGDIYDASLVKQILDFAACKEIHVVLDEVYALSVFDGQFKSSVTQMEELPDPSRTHFVWGFSKDLLLSGYRIGVIHSWSPRTLNSIRALCYYHGVPAVVQRKMTILISDTAWLDNVFLPSNRAALRKAKHHMQNWLDRLGVPYNSPRAACFFWVDFSKYMASHTEEGELELFEKFADAGVYVEPCIPAYVGRTPGFFRILFSLPKELINTGLERIEAVLRKIKMSSHRTVAITAASKL